MEVKFIMRVASFSISLPTWKEVQTCCKSAAFIEFALFHLLSSIHSSVHPFIHTLYLIAS